MIARCYTFIIFLLLSNFGYSQTIDSIPKRAAHQIIERFPSARTAGVQFEAFDNSDFRTEEFAEDIEGKIYDVKRVKAAANLPVLAIKKKFIVTLSGTYSQTKGLVDVGDSKSSISTKDLDLKYWSGSVSTTYITSLFNKPTIFTGSAIGDGDQFDMHRTRGILTSTVLLKRSATENFSIGLIGIIDKSSRVPVIPMVAYERHITGSPWTIALFFPQKIMLERRVSENSLLFVGSEIFVDRNYLALQTDKLNGVYEFSEATIRSGLTYEHRFFSHVYLLFRGGISNPINTRLVEKNSKSSDYILTTKRDGSLYFNVGLSYNLF